MANYITIDGGTTNTRLNLVLDGRVADSVKYSVGARVGSENKELLLSSVKEGIAILLSKAGLMESDIEKIIASGMITSEGGLVCLPHLIAPVGIKELSENLYETLIKEISSIPFAFIRGVKTLGAELSEVEMMRGEETELYGIFEKPLENALYILPGSHSKLISTDSEGRISSFTTTMTGEMIAALSSGTILKSSLDLKSAVLDSEYLLMGYSYAEKCGINSALFKVRILDKVMGRNKDEVYSFFIGAVLSSEIESIKKISKNKIIVAGNGKLKNAMSVLVSDQCREELSVIDDETSKLATTYGAVRIYENLLK